MIKYLIFIFLWLFMKCKEIRRFWDGCICCAKYSATQTLRSKEKPLHVICSGFSSFPVSSFGDQSLFLSEMSNLFSVRLKTDPDQQTPQSVRPTLLPM
jgi:hypothetical protein